MAATAPRADSKARDALVDICVATIDDAERNLRQLNEAIHSHPELAFQEFGAVKTITTFLEGEGFKVQDHAYGLETSFIAEVGDGGPLVIICAEYDALPNIGHACGHNLIATSSIAAFLAVARVVRTEIKPGRVRLLGTPAEEGQGGKVKLIEAGAFKEEDIAAAIMAHPISPHQLDGGYNGLAGMDMIASYKFKVEFHGRPAHAGGQPWNGLNALDAAIATYNNVSMLRQQMRPDERVHCVIEDGGTVPNVITQYSRMNWYVRSPSMKRCEELLGKVEKCCEAGALSAGCDFNFIR